MAEKEAGRLTRLRKRKDTTPIPGKVSGACKQGMCNQCYTLSCTHECHDQYNARKLK